MAFFRAIGTAFSRTLDFKGVASRRDFWFWLLLACILLAIASVVDGMFVAPMRGFLPFEEEAGSPLATVLLILFALPTLSVAVRRCHDAGWSALWLLMLLPLGLLALGKAIDAAWIGNPVLAPAALILAIMPLYLLAKSGKKSSNRFSPEK